MQNKALHGLFLCIRIKGFYVIYLYIASLTNAALNASASPVPPQAGLGFNKG